MCREDAWELRPAVGEIGISLQPGGLLFCSGGVTMSYVALYRRWRPESFADLVGQEHISHTLSRAVATGQISHRSATS